MKELEVYCRISDGKIVEYPVLALHIKNRAQPLSMYTQVYFDDKPVITRFQYLTETVKLIAGKFPVVTYVVNNMSFEQLVSELKKTKLGEDGKIDVAKLDEETINYISDVCNGRLDKLLDDFVATRKYRSVDSMAKYYDSTNPTYKTEALHVRDLCDAVWPALEQYMTSVLTKKVSFPESWVEIMKHVPEISWSNER